MTAVVEVTDQELEVAAADPQREDAGETELGRLRLLVRAQRGRIEELLRAQHARPTVSRDDDSSAPAENSGYAPLPEETIRFEILIVGVICCVVGHWVTDYR